MNVHVNTHTASLMQLLQKMGFAYQSLMSYNLTQAIEELQTIAPHHSNTPWVFSQIARAYFIGERFKQVRIQSNVPL